MQVAAPGQVDAAPGAAGLCTGGIIESGEHDDHWNRLAVEMSKDDPEAARAPAPSKWAHLGTEAQREAAREEARSAAAAVGSAEMHRPGPLPRDAHSPSQALDRRRVALERLSAARADARLKGRQTRAVQEKSYSRPRRRVDGRVVIGTVNPNSFATLREELVHGHVLTQAHYLAVQEHLCRGEACDRASRDAAAAGWDTVISPAYWKQSAPGGGTAILALQGRGAVCLPLPESVRSQLEGRCSAAYVNVLGGIGLVSYYGRSGLPLAGQIQTLSALGQVVRACGLPVIIRRDWQISPEVLAQSKFPHRGCRNCRTVEPEQPQVRVDVKLLLATSWSRGRYEQRWSPLKPAQICISHHISQLWPRCRPGKLWVTAQ